MNDNTHEYLIWLALIAMANTFLVGLMAIATAVVGFFITRAQNATKAAVDAGVDLAVKKIDENTVQTVKATNAAVAGARIGLEAKAALPEAVEAEKAATAEQTGEIREAIKKNGEPPCPEPPHSSSHA